MRPNDRLSVGHQRLDNTPKWPPSSTISEWQSTWKTREKYSTWIQAECSGKSVEADERIQPADWIWNLEICNLESCIATSIKLLHSKKRRTFRTKTSTFLSFTFCLRNLPAEIVLPKLLGSRSTNSEDDNEHWLDQQPKRQHRLVIKVYKLHKTFSLNLDRASDPVNASEY